MSDDKQREANERSAVTFFSSSALFDLVKALALLTVVALLLVNWKLIGTWIKSTTHLEFAGVKIDRTIASQKLEQVGFVNFDQQRADAVLSLTEQLWPALNGAHVLWLDPLPTNSRGEQTFLEVYGIHFSRARDSAGALWLLKEDVPFDLVVVHSAETIPIPVPLDGCPLVFSGWPAKNLKQQYADSLRDFTQKQNAGTTVAELAFVEQVHALTPELPIIVYSPENGGVVASRCAEFTDDAAVFLRDVVMALAYRRWEEIDEWQHRPAKSSDAAK